MKDDSDEFIKTLVDLAGSPAKFETDNIHEIIPNSMPIEDATKFVIREMIKEDTGKHILDSGGIGGRGFERARKIKDWDAIPMVEYDEIDETTFINLYPYLTEYLEYDRELDREFMNFAKRSEMTWDDDMRMFLDEKGFQFHCEGTYGRETDLGGLLYYCVGEKKDRESTEVILLQTHNGMDARGGYSTPHAFKFQYPLTSEDFFVGQTYE